VRLGARPAAELPEKPGYLIAYELLPEAQRPCIISGGIMEQPHLWLLEYEAIDQVVKLFTRLNNPNSQGNFSNAVSPK
jgi:hypothetical protein